MNRILKRIAADVPLPTTIVDSNDVNNEEDIKNEKKPSSNDEAKEVMKLLERIKESSNNLKDIYYVLFDNLNGLYSTYPSIYKQLQQSVKLPTNQDAINIVTLNKDLTESLNLFKDPTYLNSFLQNSSETL